MSGSGDIKKPFGVLCELLCAQEHSVCMGIDAHAENSMRVETAHITGSLVKAHQRVDFCDGGKPPVDGAMGDVFVEADDADFD